jgi:glycosyltransferase involved in cell wall biosynthesis
VTRTLLITAPYYPPDGGGLERYVETMAHLLSTEHGWRVVVVAAWGDRRPEAVDHHDGVTVHRLAWSLKLSNTVLGVRFRRRLREILDTERPDVVVSHTPVPGLADLLATLDPQVPFVVTYHTGTLRKGSGAVDVAIGAYERFVLPRLLDRADRIVASSDFIRDDFLAGYPGRGYRDKSLTISPGVDHDFFSPAPQPRPAGGRSLIFVANYGPSHAHKGLDALLQAVARLRHEFGDLTLTAAGHGDPSYFRQLSRRLGIADAVTLLPYQSREALRELYRQADAFVLPSRNESFGMVIVEAMACGLPVVANRQGGMTSLVADGETGFLVPVDDLDALVDALRRLLTDAELTRRMGAAGRRRVLAGFDWAQQARTTNALLEEVLEEHHHRHRRTAGPPDRRPLRIAMLASGSAGASLTYRAVSFGKALAARGHDVTLVAPSADKYNDFDPTRRPDVAPVRLVTPFQLRTRHRMLNLLPYVPAAALVLLRRRPDVVWLYKPTPVTLPALLPRLLRGTPVVLDMDDLGAEVMASEGGSRLEVALIRGSEALASRSADGVVTASSYLRDRYRRARPDRPVVWVPNGVESGRYPEPASGTATEPKIVFLGSMGRTDILAPLLRALPEVAEAVPHVRAVIMGDGPAAPDLRRLADEVGATGRVTWLGWVDLYAAREHVAPGDVGYSVMPDAPSIRAASNMKIFQYLAMGALPLVSDVGDQSAYVDHGRAGDVVPAGDGSALVEALVAALTRDADTRQAMIRRALALARERWDWERLAPDVEEVLWQTVETARRRRRRS